MSTEQTASARIDYRAVFAAMPGSYLLLRADPAFTIVDASEGYLRATRKTSAMFGVSVFEEFPERDGSTTQAQLLASLQRVVATKQADKMPVQRYDLDRPGHDVLEVRMWRPINVPLLSERGDVALIIHRIEDVTDLMLRAAEHADRSESASALRATEILESMTDGFLLLDRAWRVTELNAEAQRILGSGPNPLVERVLWDVVPGLATTDLHASCEEAMQHRRPTTFTAYHATKQRWYAGRARPAPDGIALYVRDVTDATNAANERDRLVEETSRERRMFETALSNTPDLVYIFDLEKRFVFANTALLRMWGVTREAALGKYLRELGYEEWHAAMHEREIDEVVRTGKAIRGEVPFSGTNGRRIYDYIFAPVLGANGEVTAIAGTTRDVTDRQAAEQSIREQADLLREADRAKDEFLAILSHELRNPLAPLRTGLAILSTQERDAGAVKIHETMSRQVEHMVRLVDDLLEVSRITRGTLTLKRSRVSIADVVRQAVSMAKPLVDENRHELTVEEPAELVEVDGDSVRLAQIIGNLLNNAAKYTPRGGRIQVTVRGESERVVVAVRDNGIGIEPAVVSKMFDMFTRGDALAGRGPGGLGIGLALARRLAELHGGTLRALSDGPGRGTEVVLELPRLALAIAPVATPTPKRVRASHRILVVDDNADAADMLGALLSSLGASVKVVYDGRVALEQFAELAPDVVFMDIGMPGMDGYEVARALRDRFAERSFKLIAVTGWGQDDDKRRAAEAGFDRHLVKPASAAAVREVLASLSAPPAAATST